MKNPINIKDYLDTVKKAEDIIGYSFTDKSLLLRALTHPSAAVGCSNEHSYERLEFLGDGLIDACVDVSIYKNHKMMDEGKMTHMKIAIVSGDNLSKTANKMGLADLIIFGKSEESTGKRGLKNALEDVYEAIVGAIFLDRGPVACWKFVYKTIISKKINNKKLIFDDNPKSKLQELMQVNHKTPKYSIVNEEGPAHNKTFYAEVKIEDKVLACGSGNSKKEAESNAATKALNNNYELLKD